MSTLAADGRVWPREESADLFRRHLEHWEEHGFGTWIFRDPDTEAFVARAGLRAVDVGHGDEVELFYGVHSEMWGRGIATEVARAIIDAAFEDLDIDHLVAFTLPTNHASRKVLHKCGFTREGDIEWAGLRHLLFRLPLERYQADAHAAGR